VNGVFILLASLDQDLCVVIAERKTGQAKLVSLARRPFEKIVQDAKQNCRVSNTLAGTEIRLKAKPL
jgi:organic hydroperoxide reductase OsmC/OhrA